MSAQQSKIEKMPKELYDILSQYLGWQNDEAEDRKFDPFLADYFAISLKEVERAREWLLLN
jgi:hypothetical protein